VIHEVVGDILLSGAEVIAHGVAPNDHFEQGLALSLRERWPAMYKDFRHNMHNNHPKEGGAVHWGDADNVRIVHLLTQEHADGNRGHPGKAKTQYVNKSLKDLRTWMEKKSAKSVALPALATGVGGLDWSEVKPIIEKHLGDADFDVYVYVEYHKDKRAKED